MTFALSIDPDPGRYAVRVEAPGEAAEGIFAAALCERPFVTSQGSASGRFQRAIAKKQLSLALLAAHELGELSLPHALDLCLLFAEVAPERYSAPADPLARQVRAQGERAWPGRVAGGLGRSGAASA